jgi:polysaccharide pyruvyl transferase WcaK-like protein
MHACVAALSSGVPVVPVAYSRKFAGLFGSIGYNAGVPVRGLDEDGVVAAIMAYLADRTALAAQVAEARAQAAERTAVYRSVLRKFLSHVAGKH